MNRRFQDKGVECPPGVVLCLRFPDRGVLINGQAEVVAEVRWHDTPSVTGRPVDGCRWSSAGGTRGGTA